MPFVWRTRFVYHQSVNATANVEAAVSGIASAIGEPARARMLYCLSDGRARTSTELATVAQVSPSTASVHLQRLKSERLVKVLAQGKHRYYSLEGTHVAAALEALSVLAGGPRRPFVPNTPAHLRASRTCYDHIAGSLGVALHDRFHKLGWLSLKSSLNFTSNPKIASNQCDLTPAGARAFQEFGIDIDATRALRRLFAYACVDWSERRPHLGGALAASLLQAALRKKWLIQELDSRALQITKFGRRELLIRFGLEL